MLAQDARSFKTKKLTIIKMEIKINKITFTVLNFKWQDINLSLPATCIHNSPFEIKHVNGLYEIIVNHKYEIIQNNKQMLCFEFKADYKTNLPQEEKMPLLLMVEFIKKTIKTSKGKLENITASLGGISITFDIPSDEELLKEMQKHFRS